MNRNNPDIDEDLLNGEMGLWATVLMGIINDLNRPVGSREYQKAWQIVTEPDRGCLPLIADALAVDVSDLQHRIIRKLRQRGSRW